MYSSAALLHYVSKRVCCLEIRVYIIIRTGLLTYGISESYITGIEKVYSSLLAQLSVTKRLQIDCRVQTVAQHVTWIKSYIAYFLVVFCNFIVARVWLALANVSCYTRIMTEEQDQNPFVTTGVSTRIIANKFSVLAEFHYGSNAVYAYCVL